MLIEILLGINLTTFPVDVVLDTSSSMEKHSKVITNLLTMLNAPDVHFFTFGDRKVLKEAPNLLKKKLKFCGNSPLYDTISEICKNSDGSPKTVLMITDGQDKGSKVTKDEVTAEIKNHPELMFNLIEVSK